MNPQSVDWERYIVRSDLGAGLRMATLDRFRDHLNHYLMSLRVGFQDREIDIMGAVDWSAIVSDEQFHKGGKFDVKLATDWFKGELTERLEQELAAAEKRKAREGNRVKMMHKVFDDMGEDKVPMTTLITGTLIGLQVPPKEQELEKDLVTIHIQNPDNHDFAVYSAGPSSGVIRVKDIKGKETELFKRLKGSREESARLYWHSDFTPGGPTRAKG